MFNINTCEYFNHVQQSTCLSHSDVGSGFQRIFSNDEDDKDTQTDFPEYWGKISRTKNGNWSAGLFYLSIASMHLLLALSFKFLLFVWNISKDTVGMYECLIPGCRMLRNRSKIIFSNCRF